MAEAVDRFAAAAAELGVEVTPQHYPDGTRTAADAAAAIGCDVAQIVKSLVCIADGEPLLVLCSGSNRVDLDAVARHLGADEVRMADASEARDATGFAIGGTPPFGHLAPLRTLVDVDLLDYDTVYAAAGRPDTNFGIAPERLRTAADAVPVDLAER